MGKVRRAYFLPQETWQLSCAVTARATQRNHSAQNCLRFILQELIFTSQTFLLAENTREKWKDSYRQKRTAIHSCRSCHWLNSQTLGSRAESLYLSSGFLRAGEKHRKGMKTNARLLFSSEPIIHAICTTSCQPWYIGQVHGCPNCSW